MCFIGHGSFGIITKLIWCNYFAVFGIGRQLAYAIMPILGLFDIALGLSLLLYSTRAVLLWLVCWGLFAAALRPLFGEPFPELIERAGNFSTPLILLKLSGGTKKSKDHYLPKSNCQVLLIHNFSWDVTYSLRAVVFLLLTGHGLLIVLGKQSLMSQ